MQDIHLEIHPEAAKSLDIAAEKLVEQLKDPAGLPPSAVPSFVPGVFVSGSIAEKDIMGDVRVSQVATLSGSEIGRMVSRAGERFGLQDESFERFAQLVDRLGALPSLRERASTECLRDLGFNWLVRRRKGTAERSFSQQVIFDLSKLVAEIEIWLPVFKLYVQSDLNVGKVVFRTISKEQLDDYEKNLPTREELKPQLDEHFRRLRKELQGTAAATITVVAEPVRAGEIAYEEAQTALALLQFFNPASFLPDVRSYATLLGEKSLPSLKYLVVRNGGLKTYVDKTLAKGFLDYFLDDACIAEIRTAGLDVLSDILRKESKTEFESSLLNALLLYSRSNLNANPADKLVYIFAALESLLLKDGNEPIQKNIGERIAWLVGTTVEEKFRIVKDVTAVYGMRSRFVHHGSTPDDLKTVRRFMYDSWCALCTLIGHTTSFQSKLALIEELERRKMGGR